MTFPGRYPQGGPDAHPALCNLYRKSGSYRKRLSKGTRAGEWQRTKSRGADGASHRPPRHPTSLFHHKTGHAENSRGRAQETGVLTAYSAAVRLSAKSLADDAIGSRTALGRAEAAARRAARVGVPSGIRLSSCAHCSTA
jgi:hypothetical protein